MHKSTGSLVCKLQESSEEEPASRHDGTVVEMYIVPVANDFSQIFVLKALSKSRTAINLLNKHLEAWLNRIKNSLVP